MNDLINKLKFSKKPKLPSIISSPLETHAFTCIKMIAHYYQIELDESKLRNADQVYKPRRKTKQVSYLAELAGFSTRRIDLKEKSLTRLSTPTILSFEDEIFVVLESVKSKVSVIHHPTLGVCKYNNTKLLERISGEVIEITPSSNFKEKEKPNSVKLSSFWESARGLKRALVKILVLTLILQIFILTNPLFMQFVVDDVLVTSDKNLLLVLSIGFGLLLLLKILSTSTRSMVIMILGSQLSVQMHSNIIKHLFSLPIVFFQQRHIGDIMSRINSLQSIRKILSTTIVESLVDGLMVVGLIVMMTIYSPLLTLIVLAFSSLYLLIRLAYFRKYKKTTRDVITSNASRNTNIMQTIRGIQTVKLFTKESERLNIYNNLNVDFCNSEIKAEMLNIKFNWVYELLSGLENIIVVFVAANLVFQGIFSVGMIFAFLAYRLYFVTSAGKLIDNLIDLKMISLHLERLGEIALTNPEENLGLRDHSTSINGALSLHNVNFSYSKEKEQVLKNINITINAGESVAIVGPSGCGKTTLMKVMLGLLEPKSGTVKADMVNITQLGLTNFRSNVASVMQNEPLMSGTILENISFFDNQPNRSLIIESATKAGIHDSIVEMPCGYQTVIGDLGSTLSGGQIQRIILARALYRKPKILFLDEATSNLDIDIENYVNDSIKSLDMTRIFIAHRPQTILTADRVLAFKEGKFIEITKSSVAI